MLADMILFGVKVHSSVKDNQDGIFNSYIVIIDIQFYCVIL